MTKTLAVDICDFDMSYKRGMGLIESCAEGLDDRLKNKIILAFEEAFVNVIVHNKDKCGFNALLTVCQDEGLFWMEIKDNGAAFNPLENKDPDTSLSAEERKIGGLGIFLIKKLMDFSEYEYKDGFNIFRFGVEKNG